MDIFNTTITSLKLLYDFINTCADFPGDAKSLSIRLHRDVRILQNVQKFFQIRQTSSSLTETRLSQENEELLGRLSEHLDVLVSKALAMEGTLKARGGWRKTGKAVTWWHYGPKVRRLQEELHEWVESFDVRLMSMPSDLKAVVKFGDEGKPAIVLTRERIERVLAEIHAETKVSASADALRIHNHDKRIKLGTFSTALRCMATLDGAPVLLEYRPYESSLLDPGNEDDFEKLTLDQMNLAYILSNVQGSNFGLPKCLGFYETFDTKWPSFVHIYETPPRPPKRENMPALLSIITEAAVASDKHDIGPRHSLSQRIRFARKLAIALLLIHSAGWVHESISSESILVLDQPSGSADGASSTGLGNPLFMGFHASRPDTADTTPSYSKTNPLIYRHPHRLPGARPRKFVRAYDVYSLGVVLLELGLWRSLGDDVDEIPTEHISAYLQGLVDSVKRTMGDTYAAVVEWCLARGDEDLLVDQFCTGVLEKLESLSSVV